MTSFSCPMHPEIKQDELGDCPKCGMQLVPGKKLKGGDAEHNSCHTADRPGDAGGAKDGHYDKVPAEYSGPVYTCPMHPQVRQIQAGSCPICGMGLELETVGLADEGPNPELVDFTRRLWVGAILTVPLLILTMGPMVGLG